MSVEPGESSLCDLRRKQFSTLSEVMVKIPWCWLLAAVGLMIVGTIPGHAHAPGDGRLFMPVALRAGDTETIGQSSWSAPLALAPGEEELWVVNPDAGTVSVIDTVRLQIADEIVLGGEPWAVAISPDGRDVYVIERGGGELIVLDAALRRVRKRLSIGPEPGGIALTPHGTQAYVPVTAAHEIAVIDTARLTIAARIPVAPLPYAVAVENDGKTSDRDARVYITHLLAVPQSGGAEATNDGRIGLVTVLNPDSNSTSTEIRLEPDAHGFPNLLSSISLAGKRAWLPHVRAAPGLPLGLTTTVFAAVLALDLNDGQEDASARLLLNDEAVFGSPVNNPVAAVPSPDGQTLYVVLAGSDLVEVIDVATPTHPRLIKFLPAGSNPRGMAVSADGARGYVMNYLSRSVTVLDLVALRMVDEVPVTEETLEADVLRGKILFNSASDPRLSKGSWISCASCHPDGGTDGVTWSFPDGPRQTPPLWNAGQTLPWHWSAALDEPQDVEETIHTIQHGLGLAPGPDPPLLGALNAGRSADLDALAAFLVRDISSPSALPLAPEALEGRRLFEEVSCAVCHGGPHWTISALPGPPGTLDPNGNGMIDAVVHDVGTLNPADVRGAEGFDVPSLLGVGLTAPYFHDGSMPSLEALLASGHPDPHGTGNGLSEDEIVWVSEFLRSIDATTIPLLAQP